MAMSKNNRFNEVTPADPRRYTRRDRIFNDLYFYIKNNFRGYPQEDKHFAVNMIRHKIREGEL